MLRLRRSLILCGGRSEQNLFSEVADAFTDGFLLGFFNVLLEADLPHHLVFTHVLTCVKLVICCVSTSVGRVIGRGTI